MSEDTAGEQGMKLLDVAGALGVSKQRAHQLITAEGLEPLQKGKSGRGTGTTYRTEDVIRLIERHLAAAEDEARRWRERLERVKGRSVHASIG